MNLLRLELPPRFQDYGLLILRLAFGFSMIYGHGFGKLTRLFGTEEIRFADPFGIGPAASLALAVFAEVLCSLLLMLGLFTRAALIPLIITMATAYFSAHFDDAYGQQEKVILFGFAFIALFFTGPGRFSLDAQLQKNKPYIGKQLDPTTH
ncbi:putative oxidoreductase [Catalinimonas alkaloidigena]|uniref:DoxX family protein n=1 Tax=Catalinimonas alkaloidigena TaxID=1075417 RepID=UPI00240599E4|nr:DoxX family protein [Catalinimonas alkaloidigena]MDF9797949.1 putative oxidoreductase [Catalinimonas alkaloidigena]